MKFVANVLVFFLVLGGSVCLGQQNNGPPPPSDEYSPQTWVSYTSNPGRFKITFPKQPRESSKQNVQTGVVTHSAEHRGLLLYVANYVDSPAHIDDPKRLLGPIRDQWLNANADQHLEVIKDESISFKGYPGRLLQLENQRTVIRVRTLIVKDRVYEQLVFAPNHQNAVASANGYEKLAMVFLDSFELLDP